MPNPHVTASQPNGNSPTVRVEQFADWAFIRAVQTACFPTTAEADLVDRLRAAGRLLLSLVAEVDGVVVGHVAFSPVSAIGAAAGVGLGPVGVVETHRRQGIAALLIENGLARCREAGSGWAVVLGDPAYYGRFGFQPAPQYGLSDEYGGGDAFQVLALLPGGIPAGAGQVRYAPEFAVFE